MLQKHHPVVSSLVDVSDVSALSLSCLLGCWGLGGDQPSPAQPGRGPDQTCRGTGLETDGRKRMIEKTGEGKRRLQVILCTKLALKYVFVKLATVSRSLAALTMASGIMLNAAPRLLPCIDRHRRRPLERTGKEMEGSQ
ncbi:hypothetical protein ATANTOWER_003108 [Ataeniobius toweri]|uniref:Uncharacterized protein n=1 Tax=Ataeniobius toweri TaxID=208326 RepID=A0ABU7AKH8_9TELE|nr:hypothetical protein [Ataeniobius toweri]